MLASQRKRAAVCVLSRQQEKSAYISPYSNGEVIQAESKSRKTAEYTLYVLHLVASQA